MPESSNDVAANRGHSRASCLGPRHCVSLVVALLAGVAAAACHAPAPPNIVLVTVDTLRADRLNPYGYRKIDTPAIAGLAAEGIVFEKAFADTSWTLPSLSSVMTGKYPSAHRVRTWNDTLGEDQVTLAETLKARGYHTAAIVGSYPLDRYFGLNQGFEHYDDEMTRSLFVPEDATPVSPESDPHRPADDSATARATWQMAREQSNAYRSDREVADAAIKWIESNPSAPMFLWVHFFGPHEKGKRRGLSPEARKAHVTAQIARYDPDIVAMDRQVGRLIASLRADPRFANTVLIFHSDHGQSLREHGLFGHGMDLYDTTVHVPLIIRLPGARRAGERIGYLVRNLDIFATVADLAGASVERAASRDLLRAAPADNNHIFMESYHFLTLTARDVDVGGRSRRVGAILRGIRTDDHKLIMQQPFLGPGEDPVPPLPENFVDSRSKSYLFHLETDPQEHKNLAGVDKAQLEQLRTRLSLYDDGSHRPAGSHHELDAAAQERLRSLGYEIGTPPAQQK